MTSAESSIQTPLQSIGGRPSAIAREPVTLRHCGSDVTRLSIVECLQLRAEWHPDRVAFRFIDEQQRELDIATYGTLWNRACTIAWDLIQHGRFGDRVALFFPAGVDFIAAFIACLITGRIAVPLNLPTRNRLSRCIGIVRDCRPALALTSATELSRIHELLLPEALPEMSWRTVQEASASPGSEDVFRHTALPSDTDDIAFLQYTSGSTSNPKGVAVSFHNLAVNVRMKRDLLGLDETSSVVSWLPHHHDAGLVWGELLPIVLGSEATLMSPRTFVRRPMQWLQCISRYRGTMTAAPNFAFDYCVDHYEAQELADCDLSCLRIVINAADRIRKRTIERFAATFRDHGYRDSAMRPGYGLAEATLFVASGEVAVRSLDADAAVAVSNGDGTEDRPTIREIVGCGVPSPDIEVAVVDPETGVSKSRDEIGEVWLRGESVALGYWGNTLLTDYTFGATLPGRPQERFLRTGDLGFLSGTDGQLYICGRLKDLIVARGRKLFAEDLECSILDCDPAIAPMGATVFEGADESQSLVAVLEVNGYCGEVDGDRMIALIERVRAEVRRTHQVTLDKVIPCAPGTIRRTTSGKIQRSLMRKLYEQGRLVPLAGAAGTPVGAAAAEPTAPCGARQSEESGRQTWA